MKVKDVMTTPVLSVEPDSSASIRSLTSAVCSASGSRPLTSR